MEMFSSLLVLLFITITISVLTDFISKARDAPRLCRFVDGLHNLHVEGLSLPEHEVEAYLANLRSENQKN